MDSFAKNNIANSGSLTLTSISKISIVHESSLLAGRLLVLQVENLIRRFSPGSDHHDREDHDRDHSMVASSTSTRTYTRVPASPTRRWRLLRAALPSLRSFCSATESSERSSIVLSTIGWIAKIAITLGEFSHPLRVFAPSATPMVATMLVYTRTER